MVLFKLCLCVILLISMDWGTDCADCNTRGSLHKFLSGRTHPRIIQAFYNAYSSKGKLSSYPFNWAKDTWQSWEKMMMSNWMPVITALDTNYVQISAHIYAHSVTFLKKHMRANMSLVLCVPIDGFDYFGKYLKCTEEYARTRTIDFSIDCTSYVPSSSNWLIKDFKETETQYCCDSRDTLINQEKPKESLIITKAEAILSKPKVLNSFTTRYHGNWSDATITLYKALLATWEGVISDKSTSVYKKHRKIFYGAIDFIDKYSKDFVSRVACIPLDDWGYFGDYLKCEIEMGTKSPDYYVECRKTSDVDRLQYVNTGQKCTDDLQRDYCCVNAIRTLNKHHPDQSTLVKSFYDVLNRTIINKTDFPFRWGGSDIEYWKKNVIKDWRRIMRNSELSNSKKLENIYAVSITALSLIKRNLSFILCVPITGFGHFGDLLDCHVNSELGRPHFKLSCKSWFDNTPTWAMKNVACRKIECCNVSAVRVTSKDAVLTTPDEVCADDHNFTCTGYRPLILAKAENTVVRGSGDSSGILSLTCKDGKYQQDNQDITSIDCTGEIPPSTTTRNPELPPDCCLLSKIKHENTSVSTLHRLYVKTCERTIYYNCSAKEKHFPIMDVTYSDDKIETIFGQLDKILAVAFTCENEMIYHSKKTVVGVRCIGKESLETTTVTPNTTTAPCCKESDITVDVGIGANVTKPGSYCQPELKYSCFANNASSRVCRQLRLKSGTEVSEECNPAKLDVLLLCKNAKIVSQDGTSEISKLECEIETGTRPVVTSCCKISTQFGTAVPTGVDSTSLDDTSTGKTCPAALTVKCTNTAEYVRLSSSSQTSGYIDEVLKEAELTCVNSKYQYEGTVVSGFDCGVAS